MRSFQKELRLGHFWIVWIFMDKNELDKYQPQWLDHKINLNSFVPFMSTRNYHVEMLNSHKVLNSDPLVFHSAPIWNLMSPNSKLKTHFTYAFRWFRVFPFILWFNENTSANIKNKSEHVHQCSVTWTNSKFWTTSGNSYQPKIH